MSQKQGEHTMKKQGFTLIELMVVIVIMGILAAVAVPKLFGMIAKSKASEIGPAAGTYIKLQDAYVSERNAVGSWKAIGYVAPGATKAGTSGATTNFTYTEGNATSEKGSLTAGTESLGKTWGASNNVALNDCKAQATHATTSDHWTIELKNTSNGNSITYTADINGDDADDCEQLTPSYKLIGK